MKKIGFNKIISDYNIKRLLFIMGFMTLSIITVYVLNFFILENIIIPDPCYYHSHETNQIFDLFYDLPAAEGFHPVPTRFNLFLTLITGGLTGMIFGIKRTTI